MPRARSTTMDKPLQVKNEGRKSLWEGENSVQEPAYNVYYGMGVGR